MTDVMNNILSKQQTEGLLKASQVAAILAVNSKTIRNWSESGKIPVAYRLGSTARFNLEQVQQALEKETENAMRKIQSRRNGKSTQPSINKN